jgi:autotransporter strand-loop-strand O-heptosyltransferase
MNNKSKFDCILAHAPFLGFSGYANHARYFFTELNKKLPVRIRNFTHTNDISYLTQEQKDMCIYQTWIGPPHEIGTPFNPNPKDKLLNIVLMETNHFYFWENYIGPKIAFSVWESSRQPETFFNKLKEFDQVWVPTQWQRQCTIDQGMSPDKVFVVHEGVDLDRFHPIKKTKKDKFQFMIFGRWDYRKYTREMVQAFVEEFDKGEPVELLLSADNPYPVDSYNSTEERLEKYGLQDNRIKILHFPSDDDYTHYVQEGDCMLMVSRSEGWGIPGCESLACGTPTLITNWGAPLEYGEYAYKVKVKELKKPENVFMQNDVPGVWAEPDFEDLKKQMRYIYENYEVCKLHTMNGLDHIRTFSWENAVNQAMEIIDNIDISKYYPVKLNIGSGEYPKDGYINIDKYYEKADVIADAIDLPYEEGSVDEVLSSHMLEHFNKYEVKKALGEWYRVLKYSGKLDLEVPNFESIVKNWLESDDKTGFAMDTIFGLQTRQGEEHKFGFTEDVLREMLLDVGFSDISITSIYTHAQDCYRAIAYKKELKYDDDIFVIDTYPCTEEKMGFLVEAIERIKKINKPIAIVTHYPLPAHILESVDYVIYDKNNPLSENYSLTYWAVVHKTVKVVTSLTSSYHGLCCLSSMKNATTFLKDKYKFLHFIEYDTIVDLEKYLKVSNYHRARNKKIVCFDYHYEVPKQDGIITNIFSLDIEWFDGKMVTLRKWDEYYNEAQRMSSRLKKGADMILEHWMWHYFEDRDMLKDTMILSKEEKNTLIVNGNLKDRMDEEPEMHFRLSETDNHKIVFFIIRDDRVNGDAWYKVTYKDQIYEGTVNFGKIAHYMFDKEGTITVETEKYKREFEIDPNETYTNTIFRFYDDNIKCLTWDSSYDKDFMYYENVTTSDDKVLFSYIDGVKTEIIGKSETSYDVEFINKGTGLTVYTQKDLKPNHWCAASPKYYIDWQIKVKDNDNVVAEDNFDVTGKNVLIQLDSTAIGDTLAWVPYLDEFRKKHSCNVYGRTFHNDMFRDVYPDVKWVEPNREPVDKIYVYYNVGCRDNDYYSNKNNWRSVPLQKVASDYLGLDYVEIRPKVKKSDKKRPIKERYVTLSEYSTFQCKFWLYPQGWQTIIDYLKKKGYKTMVISKEKTHLKNIIDKTNRPFNETINNIQHAELHLGVSSGPSWLAWGLDVPVVLVSGYSAVWGEFQDNCSRIIAPEGKCGGCFNDRDAVLDRGNWNFCPRSKNFECSTSITPDMVIKGIEKFI